MRDRSLNGIDAFDAASVPAYRGQHETVYEYIDAHIDEDVEQVRRWLRQPSISAQGVGIHEMAEMVLDDLAGLDFSDTQMVPTSGHPTVWATYDAGAPKTLMVYLKYDVQPADPSDWSAPPFDAELVDHELGTVVMGRGAVDTKGPERAFVNAIASILAAEGTLPVNLMVTAEGEEEMGSAHYPEVVDRFADRLRTCDAALMPFCSQDSRGATSLSMGVKGLLYMELEVRGGARGGPARSEIAGPLKVVVDSPAWRLTQALASLTSADGNGIVVTGFHDAIREPTHEELRLAAGMLNRWKETEAAMKEQNAVGRWIDDLDGEASLLTYLFDPCLNIDGMWTGWTGSGIQTIVPHVATAKLDARLVPDQRPDEVLALIRQHLDERGFEDVEIRPKAAYPAAQISVDTPIAAAMIGVFNKYGHEPTIAVRSSGSAPLYVFTQQLGIPVLSAGLGHGFGAHAPDEFMVIDPKVGSSIAGLAEIEKAYVDLLYAFAEV